MRVVEERRVKSICRNFIMVVCTCKECAKEIESPSRAITGVKPAAGTKKW